MKQNLSIEEIGSYFKNEPFFLLDVYINWLEENGYSKKTIDAYIREVKKILFNGYSVNDLLGALYGLICEYESARKNNKSDHGTGVAALKRLRDMIIEMTDLKDFMIAYHVEDYVLTLDSALLCYYKGFNQLTTKQLKNKKDKLYELVFLVWHYRHLLCPSNTCIKTIHGPISYYDYKIGTYEGKNCSNIFYSNVPSEKKELEVALDKYHLLLEKII